MFGPVTSAAGSLATAQLTAKRAERTAHRRRMAQDPDYLLSCLVERRRQRQKRQRVMRTLSLLATIGVWLVLMWNFS